jgi:hypothetical protein
MTYLFPIFEFLVLFINSNKKKGGFMNLEKMIKLAYEKDWTKINNFTISIAGRGNVKVPLDVDLNLALISVTSPPLNSNPLEVFMGGQWYFTNGRADMARVTLTFRDFNKMSLYKSFVNMFELSLGDYPEKNYISIRIKLDDDTLDSSSLMLFTELLIENVSELSFNNTTENQIAEFSVTFRGIRQKVDGATFFDAKTNTKKVSAETMNKIQGVFN